MHAAIVSRTHYDGIVDKVRRLLLRGPFGVHGIRQLSRALGIYDDCATSDGAGAVDECGDDIVAADAAVCVTRDAFVAALSSCGVVLTDNEVATVFAQLACSPPAAATSSPTTSASSSDDAQRRRRSSGRGTAAAGDGNNSGGGAVDAVLFVAALRARLTPLRRAWVTRVWSMFVKERDDSVTLDTLYAAHCETAHAIDYTTSNNKKKKNVVDDDKDNKDGDDDDDDELREVAAAVGSFARTFSTATNATGRVSAEEFAEYCAGVSSACSSDEVFVTYMRRTWWWWWHSPSASASVSAASPYARQKNKSIADAAVAAPARADGVTSSSRRGSGDGDCDGGASLQRAVYTEHDTLARKQAVAHVRALRTRLHHLIEDVHRPSVVSSARRVRQLTLSLRRRDVRVRAVAGVPVECGFVTREAFGDALRENRLYMTSPPHDNDDGATGTTMSSRTSTIVTDARNKSVMTTTTAAAGTRTGRENGALPPPPQTPQHQLLAALDTMGDGSVDYVYYLALLLPPLPPSRQVALSRLWQRVLPAKNARGAVDVYALQRAYCAHAAAALDDFYIAWDVRCAPDAVVRYDELLEWYTPQSLAVALDTDFVRTLAQQWRRVDA